MSISKDITSEDLAIHESSHAVVAWLFKEYIRLNRITAINDGTIHNGALAANSIKGFHNDGSKSVTALGMTLLAGVIGDTIKKEGRETVQQKKEQYALQPKELNWQLGGADETLFETNTRHFSSIYDADITKYIQFCLNLTIDFLTNPIVWNYVELLTAKLLAKPDLILEENEVNDFFEKSGFDAQIRGIKDSLMERISKVEEECKLRRDNYNSDGMDIFSLL